MHAVPETVTCMNLPCINYVIIPSFMNTNCTLDSRQPVGMLYGMCVSINSTIRMYSLPLINVYIYVTSYTAT